MKKQLLLTLAAAVLAVAALPASAQVRVTEVAPWSSGNSPIGADWFELTNTGTSAVNIAGWKMDDSSASFGSSVALSGVTSIAAGKSVIFIEDTGGLDDNALKASFISTWFGASAPSGLQFGFYGGGGVGLSTGGDGVNIFNSSGVNQASITFGASPTGPYATFDNSTGVNGTISALSAIGTHGAFAAIGDPSEIGSPGLIAAVPEPGTYALMLAGLALIGGIARKRNQA